MDKFLEHNKMEHSEVEESMCRENSEKTWGNQTIFHGVFLCTEFGTAIFSLTRQMTSRNDLSYGVLTDIVDFGISVDMYDDQNYQPKRYQNDTCTRWVQKTSYKL